MTPQELEAAFRDPKRWLHEQFEFELCSECGGDAEHHYMVLNVLGMPHARCIHQASDDGTPHPVIEAWRKEHGYEV